MTLLRFKSAASGSPIQPADSPAESSNVVALSEGTGRSLAQRILSVLIALATWPQDFVVRLFGIEIGDGVIGEDVEFCEDCRDVHKRDGCPRAMRGLCDVCGFVDLDRFGNCPAPRWRFHKITRRWPRFGGAA